ncbi:hypothetical protein B7495_13370 [Cryobacterium sp. LW097]|uniref:hypothetical protein n=1 Tax=unclassified Cryobacterium TaxID=2649013 RepID=UPI000B4CFFB8|nr:MULTISPECIES: hypothetical protein [unclassified Cryobacterium]ASD22960.1 hypothetical protein B7495_13370 [Cryobacterium sp. LW097]TFC54029.1 hypothetical protein E3O68_10425 [Cryobacterium sp. TMB3-1-2]TFC73683.1 hypothetical protein E3T21_03305 [Cryobacterium sp. TMB3-15]TFC77785.1 hypothetical protein E3T22_05465 [Cryobacterium sp. TMB3-10]TFC91679.1 hypothetical protein E3T19_03510 [Cryobacterium sp. TMT4-31]
MTTILHTIPAHRSLRPIVMTATLVMVSAGTHGPADLPAGPPVAVDRVPAHSLDRIALWAAQQAGIDRAA